MTTINTNEFKNFDATSIAEFVKLQHENSFQINIPKSTKAGEETDFEVFWDYARAAYVGQKLSEVATSFGYLVPAVSKRQAFSFEVEIRQLDKFTEVLTAIINAVNDEDENEDTVAFMISASEFFDNAFNHKIEPVTWGLLTIANDYLRA